MIFKTGSIKELWRVSFPIMICYFSTVLMIFVDRLYLAHFSTTALNAAVKAGTFAWAMSLGWMAMVSMAEVFVAQFNGKKQYQSLGNPVWQMIYLAIGSTLFFIPLGIWGAGYFYPPSIHPEEFEYFRYLMFFSPSFVLLSAVDSFFIGIGRTKIVQWLSILGNLVNIILDPIFIFGIAGYFPSLGIKGAAIATGFGHIVEVILFFILFLKKANREKYATLNYTFNKELFKKIIKVGLPPSIFITIELLGWTLFYHLMNLISQEHLFVASVCQTILLLFLFFGWGLEKGVIAMCGNFIGSSQLDKVNETLKSAFKLTLCFFAFISIPLILFPDFIINWFLLNPESLNEAAHTSILASKNLPQIRHYIHVGMIYLTFYILLENLRWVISGALTAAGDTLFLLISGALNMWLFLLIPTYFFVVKTQASVTSAFILWVVYAFIAMCCLALRFQHGKWRIKNCTSDLKQRIPVESDNSNDTF
jgi:multidrug resistance protein, MATE family